MRNILRTDANLATASDDSYLYVKQMEYTSLANLWKKSDTNPNPSISSVLSIYLIQTFSIILIFFL